MSFPIKINYQINELYGSTQQTITLYEGLMVFVGPNGSGKSQVLRSIKKNLVQYTNGRKVRLLSAGRLGHLENYRCDYDGRRGGLRYEEVSFGGKEFRQYRHAAETAYGDFHTLSIRTDLQIKVAERLRKLFNRDIYFDWDAGNLKVSFKRLEISGNPYSSTREASGLLHLVVNLAALYDNEVGALLIDEPEVSLHPQLQAFLLREIQNVAGDPKNPSKKIIIIATHSTEMIDISSCEDLKRIVFFKDASTPPVQISDESEELKSTKLNALLARLGQTHKAAFFSSQPLLVEGPSDAIICNALDRHLNLFLGAAGTQIVPIIGKGQIPIVSKLMRLIGKNPIVLADLDSFADDLGLINAFANDEQADKAAQDKGHPSLVEFARSVHSDFCKAVEDYWQYIREDAERHLYWIKRDPDRDELTARRRSTMAVLLNSDEQKRLSWGNHEVWDSLFRRLVALFDFLELAGCFILRKGTIENYYQFSKVSTSSDKLSAAVNEVDGILQQERSFIERHYSDILRALEFASKKSGIDEASALLDLLLAVIAPALAKLKHDTSNTELESITRQILGERATIFRITNATSNEDNPTLRIDLNSSLLHVSGFPLTLDKSSDLIKEVQNNIKND